MTSSHLSPLTQSSFRIVRVLWPLPPQISTTNPSRTTEFASRPEQTKIIRGWPLYDVVCDVCGRPRFISTAAPGVLLDPDAIPAPAAVHLAGKFSCTLACLSACLSVRLIVGLSVCLSVCWSFVSVHPPLTPYSGRRRPSCGSGTRGPRRVWSRS